MHVEHHPWKLYTVGTHPWNPVLLKSKVRQSQKTSNFPYLLSFAHTTAVTIHKLACFLLVSFLTKLVRLVISVWIRYWLQTLHTNKHTLLLLQPVFNNSCNVYRLLPVESEINYTENSVTLQMYSHTDKFMVKFHSSTKVHRDALRLIWLLI